MPRNGSGSYGLPAGNPVVPSTVISSTWANTTLSDIGTAITQSIANDGQTTPVANLPMATFRHTNVGNAVARNDYAAAGQVQDSSLQWLTSVAGTNTITASIAPGPTAYVAGQTFRFVAAGANTGATTLNINGLGAKAITKNGTVAMVGGEIVSGATVEVIYDGTQFQMIGVSTGQLINIQNFSASGTYTPTAGTKFVIVEIQGGGGAGGGSPATGAAQVSAGGGGGAGGYIKSRITSGFSGASVVIGAAGTGVLGNNGNAGGNSSFGALVANGGAGGTFQGPVAAAVGPGGSGGTSSVGNIETNSGNSGMYSLIINTGGALPGNGAPSRKGPGGNPGINANGSAPTSGAGGGGGGTIVGASQAARAGGNGETGTVIVWEFA